MKALRASLSLAALLLVGSCGVDSSSSSVSVSEPVTMLDQFKLPEGGQIKVFCRNGDKYILSDVYAGWDVEYLEDNKDCEGK